jgi:hypothetical protein
MTTRRFAHCLFLALVVLATLTVVAAPATAVTLDARLLVLSADGHEPGLGAITQTLDYLGTPYTVWIVTARPGGLTAAALSSGTRGFYQGVLLATGDLAYSPDGGTTWQSALSSAEWTTLRDYERRFAVREVSWYTFPSPSNGLTFVSIVDTSTTPVDAFFTAAGSSIFQYLNTANPLRIQQAYTYLAHPLDANTTPLLVDGAGNTLGAWMRVTPDGRETLALTFDGSQYLVHTLALSYGLVNWVTKGLFLGERRVYLDAQVDDIFIESDLWGGGVYRLTGDDLRTVVTWQARLEMQPVTRDLKLHMAFNGEGTSGLDNDTLTPTAKALRGAFKWISHTFDHETLDNVDWTTMWNELAQNHRVAKDMRFTDPKLGAYTILNLVTPEISGLSNPAAMQAAWDFGVRYVVSDTSRPGMNNPSPNAGIWNALQPGILEIPRYPTNLFYNVSTPGEWVAEYNFIYGATGLFPPPAGWGRDLTYAEILDFESDILLRDLLRGDANPWMFHQANLRAYDGLHSLLGDLLDLALAKYTRISAVPIQSPTMDVLGQKFAARMAYNAAGVTATIEPGVSITITAQKAAVVPVTGLVTRTSELYAGQYIGYVSVGAGQSVRIRLP